jgi:hypothetical protein
MRLRGNASSVPSLCDVDNTSVVPVQLKLTVSLLPAAWPFVVSSGSPLSVELAGLH